MSTALVFRAGFLARTLLPLVTLLAAPLLHGSTGWLDRAWQTDEGLPDNVVTGIAQTPDGYLWIGSFKGLVRFDGVRFQEIPLDNLPGKLNSGVRAMLRDHAGRLWLAMDRNSVVCIDPTGVQGFATEGQSNEPGNEFAEDRDGGVWLAYNQGLCRIWRGKMTYYTQSNGLPANGVCQVANDRDGQLWFACGNQIGIFRNNKFDTILKTKAAPIRIGTSYSGGIWLCSGDRLLKCEEGRDPVDEGQLPLSANEEAPHVVYEDRKGILWIGTAANGLFRQEGSTFVNVPTSHGNITCLMEDREGDLWVGTDGGGLNRLRPQVVELLGTRTGMAVESVRSIAEDAAGAIWVTTQSGMLARHDATGWLNESSKSNWPGGHATCVTADRNGALWIGTADAGLYRLQNGQYTNWRERDGLSGDNVLSLIAAANGDLYVGTFRPQVLHRLRDGKITALEMPKDTQSLRAMAEDVTGTVWAGTAWGQLLRVDGDRVVECVISEHAARTAIRCLHATLDGSLWIGYSGGGLGRWKDGQYSHITKAQGFGDDRVSQMATDQEGRFWFAGDHGIFQVSYDALTNLCAGRIQRLRSFNYGRGEEMPNLQATFENSPATLRDREGRIWFATHKGAMVVHPENVSPNPHAPPVYIERVNVDGRITAVYDSGLFREQNLTAVMELRQPPVQLSLPPGYHKVEFEFTALSFPAPDNVFFRYRLEGFGDDWTEVDSPRRAVYSRLPAGSYQFHVQACNNNGVWNDQGAFLNVTVASFFWQTWWFRTGAAAGCAGLLVTGARLWSNRRLRRQLQILEQQEMLEKERSRIARNLHDDMGASLTQLGLMLEEMRENSAGLETVQEQSTQLSSRVLTLARDLEAVVWTVNPRNDSLAELVAYLSEYFLESFRPAHIRPRLEVADEFPTRRISPEARHHLFLAAKEMINNVIKHSGATEVCLKMGIANGVFNLDLVDNGRGFDVAAVANSKRNGLRNLRTRVEELGGTLTFASRPGAGTSVTIRIILANNFRLQKPAGT